MVMIVNAVVLLCLPLCKPTQVRHCPNINFPLPANNVGRLIKLQFTDPVSF